MRTKVKERMTFFDVFAAVFLGIVVIVSVFPFLYVLAGSFNSGTDYMRGGVYFFPRKFSLDSYRTIFQDERLYYGMFNTALRTIIGPVIHTLFCAVVGYAMASDKLKGRKFYYWANTIPMFFGGGLIPYYLVLKWLGLVNTFLVYIIPMSYSVWNMIVMQNFFRETPRELRESAYIDGAGEFTIFARIYLPLNPAVLMTVGLWSAVAHWNSFFDGLYYNSEEKLILLQEYLFKLIKESSITQYENALSWLPETVKLDISVRTVQYAALVLSMVPVVLLFPLLKKYFVTGVTAGSVKG